jgi:hypothetical protein
MMPPRITWKTGIRANEAEADAWLNEHWAKVLGAHNRG